MNAPIDISNIRIETKRLILRPWTEADLDDLYEYAKVDGVGQMAGWQPHESKTKSKMILDMFISEKKTFALELKENGKVIGSLGIEPADQDHADSQYLCREIGYVLGKDYWGKGFMPEAVKAVINYCFVELSYDYLLCGHFHWNDQSRRVIEKCGFSYSKDTHRTTRQGTEELTKLYILHNPNK